MIVFSKPVEAAKPKKVSMSQSPSPVVLELRDRISHLEGGATKKDDVLTFGVEEIDGKLPGGGLEMGALHEVAGGGADAVHVYPRL